MPLLLSDNLELNRCPHCRVVRPNLRRDQNARHINTMDHANTHHRTWSVYVCATCGGLVTAFARNHAADRQPVVDFFPKAEDVDQDLPERAQNFFKQATDSLHAPAGAILLCASAVDAMLKSKGYKTGKLYGRIAKAIEDHVLTEDMGKWAHAVRLEANEERHADEEAEMATTEDARRCIDFVSALGLFLFTLPKRIERGIASQENANDGDAASSGG